LQGTPWDGKPRDPTSPDPFGRTQFWERKN
jgi:hypothetical protein